MSERAPGATERGYAEWYVWAKRNLSPSNATCHAAARAAMVAQESGQDPLTAARQSAASRSGPGWESPADPWTRGYAEWFDWARLNLRGEGEANHIAAAATINALHAGADPDAAMDAARAAVGGMAPPRAPATASELSTPGQKPALPPTTASMYRPIAYPEVAHRDDIPSLVVYTQDPVSAATWSLILGLVSWFVCPFIGAGAAVLLGHSARAQIRQRPYLRGSDRALAGMILGYAHLAIYGLALLLILGICGLAAASGPATPH